MKIGLVIPWLVILGICGYLVVAHAREAKPLHGGTGAGGGDSVTKGDKADEVNVAVTMVGKYAVGWSTFLPANKRAELAGMLAGNAKSPADEVAAAVVDAELAGKEKGVEKLKGVGTPDAAAFVALYEDGALLPADVVKRYGFFAELAAVQGRADTDRSRRAVLDAAKGTAFVVIGAVMLVMGAGAAGFGLFVAAIVMLALGKFVLQVGKPVGPGKYYVQAFAIYLVFLEVVPEVMAWLWPHAPLSERIAEMFLAVVLAVAYPLMRGATWGQVRKDWGIEGGRNVFLEPVFGLLGYLAALPLLAAAIVTTIVVSRWANYDVSHPITEVVKEHPYLIFFLAVIFAPITEELMFRGMFVSHCRGWTGKSWGGAVAAGAVTGVVFAALHPQGWPAIPLLGTMGFCLAMIRQWRGTLIPSITAHAINNGFVVALLLATQ